MILLPDVLLLSYVRRDIASSEASRSSPHITTAFDVNLYLFLRFFPSGSSIWEHQPQLLHPNTAQSGVDCSLAQYTGGMVTVNIK